MGNTIELAWLLISAQDHPHIHGEYINDYLKSVMRQGSPPHTWGILSADLPDADENEDHPHIHGEYKG